jgi:citrate lyase subunit beta/citryl-CoA lyase
LAKDTLEHISQRAAAPIMRSVMTVPVIVPRFIDKAPESGADVLCLDLEDSVPPAEKVPARALARKAIETMPRTGYAMYIRVNGFWTGLIEEDLRQVVVAGLEGIILSKTESTDEIAQADEWLSGLERERGMKSGAIALMPLIETAKGVANSYPICQASPRLTGAVFGAEDYATDMGIERTEEGQEILWARSQVAIAAHAAGITAIDTPDPDYTDAAHLRRQMKLARNLGYRGKLCIHPLQVQIANEAFAPAEAEVAEARAIVEAFERDGLAQGRAAIPLDGKMVDTPIYWRAKQLLSWAETAGG